MSMPRLSFLGATGTVTGSRYLVERGTQRLLVDCGLFQGLKALRLRNWSEFPVAPAKIQHVLLTHAHLDHSGYLPKLLREGFTGSIHASAATRDLCDILLRDSASIQEEEAAHANHGGWSKHKPSMPLYTIEDAAAVLHRFKAARWHEAIKLDKGTHATFRRAGHILGAASVHLDLGGTSILFSGDLGRNQDVLLPDPEPPMAADYVLIESTYGNRLHENIDPEAQLHDLLQKAWQRGGSVLIPAFAVGRVQTLLWHLRRLRDRGLLPPYPIWVDSPMASRVSGLYESHCDDHLLPQEECRRVFDIAKITETHQDSMALQASQEKRIVISASGMATGGRVLFHLANMLGDARNLILFSGFQAAGTRGADLIAGLPQLKLHGRYHDVKAEVVELKSYSAHADQKGLLSWLGSMPKPPKKVFLVHGEPQASDALRRRILDTLGWPVHLPEYMESVELT